MKQEQSADIGKTKKKSKHVTVEPTIFKSCLEAGF